MKMILKIDHFLGRYFSLSETGWIKKHDFSKNNKTMDEKEWKQYRQLEKNYGESTLFSWIKLLATKEARNFHIFEEIYGIILKKKYERLFELGSGQCHIAFLLQTAGIDVEASEITDENLLIKKINNLDIKINKVRLENISTKVLRDIDCIFAVQVDYIFNREDIYLLLLKSKMSEVGGADVLFVNTQIIGLFQYIKYRLKKKSRLLDKNCKRHGYVRSLGVYKKMGRKLGMNVEIFKNKNPKLSTYYFILFTNQK